MEHRSLCESKQDLEPIRYVLLESSWTRTDMTEKFAIAGDGRYSKACYR